MTLIIIIILFLDTLTDYVFAIIALSLLVDKIFTMLAIANSCEFLFDYCHVHVA